VEFKYNCIDCGKEKPKNAARGMFCHYCGGELRGQAPHISTTDTFGKRKAFIDERTGKEINTWKNWEKAGFGDVKDIKNHDMKEKVKEQLHKRSNREEKKINVNSLPI